MMYIYNIIKKNEAVQVAKVKKTIEAHRYVALLYYIPLCLLGISVGIMMFIIEITGSVAAVISIIEAGKSADTLSVMQTSGKLVFLGPVMVFLTAIWVRLCWKILLGIISAK